MSYSHALLFASISKLLHQNPRSSIARLSRELRISPRTIQHVINAHAGKAFSGLREEILMERVTQLLLSQPGWAIKEVSFAVGFRSPRSFARAVRRACGFSPEDLRSCLTRSDL